MIVRKMKLLAAGAVVASSVVASAAYAAYPAIEEPIAVDNSGFYVGGEIGWGKQGLHHGDEGIEPTVFDSAGAIVNPDTAGNIVDVDNDNHGSFAGRINIGYNFNEFFAIELGGAGWSEADYDWDVYNPAGTLLLASGHGDVNSYAIDLLGKVTYPFANGFKVFAKGGAAYVWSSYDLSNSLVPFAPILRHDADDSHSQLRPEAAVGIGYNIDDNWSVSAQYSYIWGNNHDHHDFHDNNVPSLQLATVGVQYDIT